MTCTSSTVEPSKVVVVNDVPHAGLVTHKCDLQEHAADVSCVCKCGHTWIRNFK